MSDTTKDRATTRAERLQERIDAALVAVAREVERLTAAWQARDLDAVRGAANEIEDHMSEVWGRTMELDEDRYDQMHP